MKEIIFEKIESILEEAGVASAGRIDCFEIKSDESNLIFRVNCNGVSYALKVFLNSDAKNRFFANTFFHQLAKENDISVGRIIYASDDFGIVSAYWILWEWLNGTPLHKIHSESRRYDAAVLAGIQLRKLHRIQTDGFGWPDANGNWSGENVQWAVSFFKKRIDRSLQKMGVTSLQKDMGEILESVDFDQSLGSFFVPCLLHGDITGGNVIVTSRKNVVLIDPGEIVSGDPMADLGYSQNTKLDIAFRKGIWDGYMRDVSLTREEYERFLRWRLLRQCVIACRSILNQDVESNIYVNDVRKFYKEL